MEAGLSSSVALTIIACECYVDRTGGYSGEVMSKDEDEPSREIAVCGRSRHAEAGDGIASNQSL